MKRAWARLLCLAKGTDAVALKMREAREGGTTCRWSRIRHLHGRSMRRSRSTRKFRKSTYKAVAEVIGFVFRMRKPRQVAGKLTASCRRNYGKYSLPSRQTGEFQQD